MNIEGHQLKVGYRVSWKGAKQNRSRFYTRKSSAERKAEQMRADGKECDITTWLMIELDPVPPVGDISDRSHETPWPEPEKMRAQAPDDYTYEWFQKTWFMSDGVNKAVEYGFQGGAVPLTVFRRKHIADHEYELALDYFRSFPEYYEVREATETDPGHVRLVGHPTLTTRIYP